MTDVNDIAARWSHLDAWNWHRRGAKCFTYAGTFTGPESPDLLRLLRALQAEHIHGLGSVRWRAGDTFLSYQDGSLSVCLLELHNGIQAAEKFRIL